MTRRRSKYQRHLQGIVLQHRLRIARIEKARLKAQREEHERLALKSNLNLLGREVLKTCRSNKLNFGKEMPDEKTI